MTIDIEITKNLPKISKEPIIKPYKDTEFRDIPENLRGVKILYNSVAFEYFPEINEFADSFKSFYNLKTNTENSDKRFEVEPEHLKMFIADDKKKIMFELNFNIQYLNFVYRKNDKQSKLIVHNFILMLKNNYV